MVTRLPMFHAHGRYQTATPLFYYTDQTCLTTGYFTTKGPENYTTATTPNPRSIILLPRGTLFSLFVTMTVLEYPCSNYFLFS